MKSVQELILKILKDEDIYSELILRWSEIVGENNKQILYPLKIKENTLFIAVPNPMIKSVITPILGAFIAKIKEKIPKSNVNFIKLSVEPEYFTQVKTNQKKEENQKIQADLEDIQNIAARLISEGIEKKEAYKMAEIEALIKKREELNNK